MIRYCAANPRSSRGGEIGPSCALLRNRKSEVLVRQMSGNPTNQDLASCYHPAPLIVDLPFGPT